MEKARRCTESEEAADLLEYEEVERLISSGEIPPLDLSLVDEVRRAEGEGYGEPYEVQGSARSQRSYSSSESDGESPRPALRMSQYSNLGFSGSYENIEGGVLSPDSAGSRSPSYTRCTYTGQCTYSGDWWAGSPEYNGAVEPATLDDEMADQMDSVFSRVLHYGRDVTSTINDIKAVRDELPDMDITPWLRLTSLPFQRAVRAVLDPPKQRRDKSEAQIMEDLPSIPVKRLLHRRGVALAAVSTYVDPFEEEEEEVRSEDEEPNILEQRGEWMKVSCDKGVYYYNEATCVSQWESEGTPFEGDEEGPNEAGEERPCEEGERVPHEEETLPVDVLPSEEAEATPELEPEEKAGKKRSNDEVGGEVIREKRKKRRRKDPVKERERKRAQKVRRRLNESMKAGLRQEEGCEKEAAQSPTKALSVPRADSVPPQDALPRCTLDMLG